MRSPLLPAGQLAGAEDGRCDERRDQACRVVVVDRALRVRCRQQVEAELGNRRDQHQRRRREEEREREQQSGEVVDPLRVEGDAQEPARIGEDGGQDLSGRVAESPVAVVEAGRRAFVEVRQDELHGDSGRESAQGCDRSADAVALPRQGVPDAHRGDHERDLLLRQRREPGEDRERNEPVLVQVPEGEQEQRARERDWMELREGQPLDGRIEQVRERETEPGTLRPEVLARQPEDRKRSERDRDRLRREEHARAGPDPPERSERDEDRIDVRPESRHLLPLEVRDRQWMPVRGRPHRLGHVPEVEPARVEGMVAEDRERAEAGGVGADRRPQQVLRPEAHRSASISERQRGPSTSSLARSS